MDEIMTGRAIDSHAATVTEERTGGVHLIRGVAVPSSRGRGLVIATTYCDRMIAGTFHENDDRLTCSDCESERLDA